MEDVNERGKKMGPELAAIHARLDDGESRMTRIESSVGEIARNTAGLVIFSGDIAAGARLICRLVLFIQFILRDVVKPFWVPALVVFAVIYFLTHNFTLPPALIGILGIASH